MSQSWVLPRPDRPFENSNTASPTDGTQPRTGTVPVASADQSTHVNENHGDAETIVQAGIVNGGVHTHHRIGRQYNYYAVDLFEAGRFDPAYVAFVQETFVSADPAGHARFVADLKDAGFGVVTGDQGSGRRSAAITALSMLGIPIRPVHVEEDEAWDPTKLVCDSGHGYLIDLSATGPVSEKRAQSLHDYAAKARERGSVAVVIMRGDQRPYEVPGARVLSVSTPPSMDVLRSHLRRLVPENVAAALQASPDITEALADAAPASAARMARLASEAYRSEPDAPAERRLSLTLSAYGNWGKELKTWFSNHRDGAGAFDRVLLAAVAMLENEPADRVLLSATELAEQLGVPPDDPTGISGDGLSGAVERIDAKVVPDRTVRFASMAYGSAALDYLWTEHPRVRTPLLQWSIGLPKKDSPSELPKRLAQRWLELAERHDDFPWLSRLFTKWAQASATREAAVSMASQVAGMPRGGRHMRSTLYQIAKRPESSALAAATAQVCAAYGALSPTTALTRLKWLADHDDDTVRQEVLKALDGLAVSRGLRPQLLGELNSWISDSHRGGRSEVAHEALAALLRRSDSTGVPVLLTDMATYRRTEHERVIDAWYWLLDTDRSDLAAPVIDSWLTPLVENRADFSVIAAILSAAAARSILRSVAAGRLIDQWSSPRGLDATETIVKLHMRLRETDPLGFEPDEALP